MNCGDNRIFNVNGCGDDFLLAVLKLAFEQDNSTARGYEINEEKGFVLYKYDGGTKFPTPLNAEQVFPLVVAFLESEEAKDIVLKGWDAYSDHDGHNVSGWRVYCEDWGHVGSHSAFLAITPAAAWMGK